MLIKKSHDSHESWLPRQTPLGSNAPSKKTKKHAFKCILSALSFLLKFMSNNKKHLKLIKYICKERYNFLVKNS